MTHISSYDSHGGFHGDGVSCIALTFEDDQLEQQLAKDFFNEECMIKKGKKTFHKAILG